VSSKVSATYRPDIDGVRTLAVLPVVLFHAGIPYVTGGFVGVDVFIVISGFLITGILSAEISEDSFSILEFYRRRSRRIFSALTLFGLAALPIG
jgi:peptidoglycan/LPS O-acetylase OafA/YrhL